MNSLEELKEYVNITFDYLGINKKQELVRLLYEIVKRGQISLRSVIEDISKLPLNFKHIKKYLLERRFPDLTAYGEKIVPFLPHLSLDEDCRVEIKKFSLNPKNIYVEESAQGSYLIGRFKERFPAASIKKISSLKEYIRNKNYDLKDYNARRDNFFIVRENFDFFKACPCTPKAVSCGYHIFNLGTGCVFECTYCYLQNYINSPGIIIPANIEDFFSSFSSYKKDIRLGTGEFMDSLALDDITSFSPQLAEFFRKHPQSILELKTKSDNIKTLLSGSPSQNVIAAWSINPQNIIDKHEHYSADLKQRLKAAAQCSEAGFRTAFHFDPIIYYSRWERDYEDLVNLLFKKVKSKDMAWISLGTFRFPRGLKRIIENRFPESDILDGELAVGFDGKLRYSERLRVDIYKKMLSWIRKYSRDITVYLCMEESNVWDGIRLPSMSEKGIRKILFRKS